MSRALFTVALLLSLEAAAWAEDACPSCVIGVYDDSLSWSEKCNIGYWDVSPTNLFKEIFISIDFDPASGLNGLTGIEISISGLPSGPIPPADEWFPAPASISGLDIQSGKVITWDNCLPGNRILGKITLVSVAPVGSDRVIRVQPSNPSFPFPLLKQCDAPIYTQTAVTGGCYVLNPSFPPRCFFIGGCFIPPPCCQAVEPETWSRIKNLYR